MPRQPEAFGTGLYVTAAWKRERVKHAVVDQAKH
jgi:hypothetical protein